MNAATAIATLPRTAHALSADALDLLTQRLAAHAEVLDRSGDFPHACFDILAESGLVGLTVAPEHGGQGAGVYDALRVLGAVAKGEPSTALILFMTYGHHLSTVRAHRWPDDIYARLAREAANGHGLIGAFRVEPELGTPVRGGLPKTTARRTVDGWVLNGTKIYSTGSTGLDWFTVFAKTDEDEPRVGPFLVKAGSPGITIDPAWDHLGMRATVSHAVTFTETPVPADHALDIRPLADWAPTSGDHGGALWNALAISTIYDGVARAARDWLRDYLKTRTPSNLGAPLSSLPRVQEKFGEIDALLRANSTLIQSAAQRFDAGDPPGAVEVNSIKYIATTHAIRAVEIGLELTGNPGLSRQNPLERHYRDVLCSRIHSPQNDTILTAAGRAAFAI